MEALQPKRYEINSDKRIIVCNKWTSRDLE